MSDPHYYVCGVDPAPSESASADDGAIVVLKCWPRRPPPPNEPLPALPADWLRAPVMVRRIRKYSARDWSGELHDLHKRFGFVRMGLDAGGGGQWIKRELAQSRQWFQNTEVECVPIVTLDEISVAHGNFILSMIRLRDPCIQAVWPDLAGDDVLADTLYATLKLALETGQMLLLPPFEEWPAPARAGLQAGQEWTLRNMTTLHRQLRSVSVATKEDPKLGPVLAFTARGARQFRVSGRKDFVSALMHAEAAFLSWLKGQDDEFLAPGDEGMCSGW